MIQWKKYYAPKKKPKGYLRWGYSKLEGLPVGIYISV